MKSYSIVYSEYDPEHHEIGRGPTSDGQSLTKLIHFDAIDPIHAINQLLDFYKDLNTRVECVYSVREN